MACNGSSFNDLGLPWHDNMMVALPPPEILNAPFGTYGVIYELFTHKTEDIVQQIGKLARHMHSYPYY